MRGSTGDLTVVAIHTERFIDQQHIGCSPSPWLRRKRVVLALIGLRLDILSEALAHLRSQGLLLA